MSPPRSLKKSALRALAVVLCQTLLACSPVEKAPEPVRSVKLYEVSLDNEQPATRYAGEVRARVESRLSFRVGGKVVSRSVDLGQLVQKGQELARLDARDFDFAVQAAQAQVLTAQTQRDLARSELKRFEDLRRQNFISDAELERRSSAFKSAQAALDQALAQAAIQNNQRGDIRLLAQHDGVVTSLDFEAGQVVAAGQAVVRVAQQGPRDVIFAVPEQHVHGYAKGDLMQIQTIATGPALSAKVREIAASADPATRTYEVKLGLEQAIAPPLGATVTVIKPASAAGASPATLLIPHTALWRQGAQNSVWLLDESKMTVHARPVEVESIGNDRIKVTKGLERGQSIVAAGVHVLTEGQRVSRFLAKP